ncbi:unnamed protein product [Cuscuta campestris]|uniref:Uncharacterized protein n=1 Tax=Cuscuta campestris TaxID=132261 RepID=A0A484N732_9ASTE|nr:unnamed protein product [Cuscuta campestris]
MYDTQTSVNLQDLESVPETRSESSAPKKCTLEESQTEGRHADDRDGMVHFKSRPQRKNRCWPSLGLTSLSILSLVLSKRKMQCWIVSRRSSL